MKQSQHHIPAIFIAALLFLTACRGFNDIEIKSVDGFDFKGINNNSISFKANISVVNPSSLGFKVKELNLKTFAAGNYLGTLTSKDIIKIPAHSDSSYRVQFNLKFANIFSGASTLYSISRLDKVEVEVQGYVKARSFLVSKRIDVHEKRIINVPRLNR
jgi:hypothetical protein